MTLDQASLDRIDEISRHPTISRGVSAVVVTLAYRPKKLADNVDIFVDCRIADMKMSMHCHRGYFPSIDDLEDA